MLNCIHLGPQTGKLVDCPSCKARTELKLFKCRLYGACTLKVAVDRTACCNGTRDESGATQPCLGWTPEGEEMTHVDRRPRNVTWAYGLTTVPERRDELLPKTLASLAAAGFDKPRLFVDGAKCGDHWERTFGLEVVTRFPKIRTFGNWTLGLAELFIREPNAERYAMFQDDFVTYRNLRTYLDTLVLPEKTYWNLYTFPSNEWPANSKALRDPATGFYESNQNGRGAVGLVFGRKGVIDLLTSLKMIERPIDPARGYRNIDGGIVNSLKDLGYVEMVHNPSLVQHKGLVTTVERNRPHKQAGTFRGDGFDAAEMIKT